jgi:hypothetical protein
MTLGMPCAENGGILLANPKISFHCPKYRFLMEAFLVGYGAYTATVCPWPDVYQEAFSGLFTTRNISVVEKYA